MDDFEDTGIVFERRQGGVVECGKARRFDITRIVGFLEERNSPLFVSEASMELGERERRDIAVIAKVCEIGELLLESKAVGGIETGFSVHCLDGIGDFGLPLEEKDRGQFGNWPPIDGRN